MVVQIYEDAILEQGNERNRALPHTLNDKAYTGDTRLLEFRYLEVFDLSK